MGTNGTRCVQRPAPCLEQAVSSCWKGGDGGWSLLARPSSQGLLSLPPAPLHPAAPEPSRMDGQQLQPPSLPTQARPPHPGSWLCPASASDASTASPKSHVRLRPRSRPGRGPRRPSTETPKLPPIEAAATAVGLAGGRPSKGARERIAAVPPSRCRTLGRLHSISVPPLSNGDTMVCTSSDHCEDCVSKNTEKRGRASGPCRGPESSARRPLCRRRCGNRHLLTPSLSQSSGSCATCEACGPRLTPPVPLSQQAFASPRHTGLESRPGDTPYP